MLLMESVSKIRRWVLVEGRSIRSVARVTGLSRNTIKKYLKDESPPSYQRQAPPVRHKLCNGFDLRLQDLFDQDQKRPRRERHRLWVPPPSWVDPKDYAAWDEWVVQPDGQGPLRDACPGSVPPFSPRPATRGVRIAKHARLPTWWTSGSDGAQGAATKEQ